MLHNVVSDLILDFKGGCYSDNFMAVRFFLIIFPYAYALNYLLEKLTYIQLSQFFNVYTIKDFKLKLGAYYGN